MRERTIKIGGQQAGRVLLFSPPIGTTWGGRFGMQVQRAMFPGQVLMTPGQARRIAAELMRRADDIEARKRASTRSEGA